MAKLRLAEIAATIHGHYSAGGSEPPQTEMGERLIEGYSIDTRTLQAGDLFFAIVGPRVDGHDFVPQAIEKGAAAVVVGKAGAAWKKAPAVLRVRDTTTALQELGAHVRRRRPIKVVGITGSAGKTTAKEMTAAVLGTKLKTARTEGNLNNTFGLPLTLLRLADDSQAAVLEMGMSYKGEIARLAEIADPDVGVILNVLRVHLEHFRSLDDIARAKGELFAGMRRNAVAVYNADDPRVARMGRAFPGPRLSFGLTGRGREVTAEKVRAEGLAGTEFVLRHAAERTKVRLGLVGRHHVYNALAAAACGYACGLDGQAIAAGLRHVAPAPMRGVLHTTPSGVAVLDDAYNSNPVAMERAIEILAGAKPRGRRILVTGDMLELGSYAPRAHRLVGQLAARAGLELLVAVGPLSERTAEAARAGLRGRKRASDRVAHFATSDAAAAFVVEAARRGDLVLVKGSRGMKMERVVQALLKPRGKR